MHPPPPAEQLERHLYVLVRFARLAAPAARMAQQIDFTLDAYEALGGDAEATAPQLREHLAAYRAARQPLIDEAARLLPDTLSREHYRPDRDPCYLAQRAKEEGWPVRAPDAMARVLALAARCDELDDRLQQDLRRLFGLAREG